MKIRNGWVSNSSSSSFIVIIEGKLDDAKYFAKNYTEECLVIDRDFGEFKFGWEVEDHCDVGSKIIFAYLQAKYIDNQEWVSMLEECIKKHNPNIKEIDWKVSIDWCSDEPKEGFTEGYIDHQSSSYEGENIEMFNSISDLETFLFSSNSYIHTDNDNH